MDKNSASLGIVSMLTMPRLALFSPFVRAKIYDYPIRKMALLPFDCTCHRLSCRVIGGRKCELPQTKISASFGNEMMQIII